MSLEPGIFRALCFLLPLTIACTNEPASPVLYYENYQHYIDTFNKYDNELYIQNIPNSEVHGFFEKNIPLVDLPDKTLEKIYYFRWWTYRKHLKKTEDGFVVTEFLPDVPWAGKHNAINCPAGHHIYEGRWLRNRVYIADYLQFWLHSAGDDIRRYSFWAADAFLAFLQVFPDMTFAADNIHELIQNYEAWETQKKDPGNKLFWQIDNRDGMEVSAGGQILNGGTPIGSMAGVRPTINSYMFGDAVALSQIARFISNSSEEVKFAQKALVLKEEVENRLWNDSLRFFTVLPRNYNEASRPIDVRELIGYTPWYFNLPSDDEKYVDAWTKIVDTTGFFAPYGLTVCEQSHPYFQISYQGHECQWNGPSWPFATTVTLKALARYLNNYNKKELTKKDYYQLLSQYAESHRITMESGIILPWIDENLNPYTGDWISRTRLKNWNNRGWSDEKGGVERGKDYNHSGFCDLIISDLIGVRPTLDHKLVFQPLVPDDWDWFCLDHILYHNKNLTILWDETGNKFDRGKGLQIFKNDQLIHRSDHLEQVEVAWP